MKIVIIIGRQFDQMLDQDCLLVRLELQLKRCLVGFVLAEQHPAGFALIRDLLHHAQAPLLRFHFQNKGSADHGVGHCVVALLLGLVAGVAGFGCWGCWVWLLGLVAGVGLMFSC